MMPTYEYRCESCGVFDYFQSITSDPLTECPDCGKPVQRLISRNGNIIFKGSGWHVTDYRDSRGSSNSDSDSDSSDFDSDSSLDDFDDLD